MLKQTQ